MRPWTRHGLRVVQAQESLSDQLQGVLCFRQRARVWFHVFSFLIKPQVNFLAVDL
jgi:hypothetical protein